MTPKALIDALTQTVTPILACYDGLTEAQLRWKPSPARWSLLEILAHLADEERLDFRPRLRATLEAPSRPWPPIDPEGWVTARSYNTRDLAAVRTAFAQARAESLVWLRSLEDVEWTTAHTHPALGPLQAGDLLAAWAAHDLLHLGQIARTRLAALQADAAPFSTRYAMP